MEITWYFNFTAIESATTIPSSDPLPLLLPTYNICLCYHELQARSYPSYYPAMLPLSVISWNRRSMKVPKGKDSHEHCLKYSAWADPSVGGTEWFWKLMYKSYSWYSVPIPNAWDSFPFMTAELLFTVSCWTDFTLVNSLANIITNCVVFRIALYAAFYANIGMTALYRRLDNLYTVSHTPLLAAFRLEFLTSNKSGNFVN